MNKYMMPKLARTDYLYATPKYLLGMGSIFSIFGFYFKYNAVDRPDKADSFAIHNDWKVIGQDLQKAIDSFPSK